MLQARLKPYDPRRGHVIQRISFGALDGKRFEQGFWYAVSETEAAFLREQHQIVDDPSSPLSFDVCTAAEAEQLTTNETRAFFMGTPNAHVLVAPTGRDGPDTPQAVAPERVPEAPLQDKRPGPAKRKA